MTSTNEKHLNQHLSNKLPGIPNYIIQITYVRSSLDGLHTRSSVTLN